MFEHIQADKLGFDRCMPPRFDVALKVIIDDFNEAALAIFLFHSLSHLSANPPKNYETVIPSTILASKTTTWEYIPSAYERSTVGI